MKSEKIKIYLDTNILDWTHKWILGKSSDPLPKKKESQIPALRTIYEIYSNEILFCVSMHTDSEIMNINNNKRYSNPQITSMLNTINKLKEKYHIDIDKRTSSICVFGHSRLSMARLCDEEGTKAHLYDKIRLTTEVADAIHLVDSFDFNADIFLTVDYRTILNKRDEIKQIMSEFIDILICDPKECSSYLNCKFKI